MNTLTHDARVRDRPAADTAARPRRLARVLAPVVRALHRLTLVLLVALLWELAARLGWINTQVFPPPSAIANVIASQLLSGALPGDVWASLSRVFTGVVIAAVFGIVLGSLLARYDRLAFYISPAIELVRPISVIAWIPVAIIWFGLGDRSAWFIIALGAFFPVFTNTFSGMKQIPPVYLQAAKTLGLGRRLLFTQVLWPAALPGILSGIRIGLGVGWMCVIAAEMIAASSGLGYLIQTARVLIETELVFAGMLVIGAVGFAMNWLMLLLEHHLTPWLHRSH
jgi:ABC-type nitrate/sulfonate/bicarbonate transport system permease component